MSGSPRVGFLRWADGGEVVGNISLEQFPLNFTLLNHAGVSGLIFLTIWVGVHRLIWTSYNWVIFGVVAALFLLMAATSPQFANNVSQKKLTTRRPDRNFDWLHYARSWMKVLIIVFSINTSMLIWATGGLSSPFIPFYIMVFILALNYCRFPQPATSLTFTFITVLLAFLMLAEIPFLHQYVPPPVDGTIQQAINNNNAKRFFDGGFVIASMLVPFVSMFLAARRNESTVLIDPTSETSPDTSSSPTQTV
jgi:hypothetical protein